MELEIIGGLACAKKQVENIDLYKNLLHKNLTGIPRVMMIEDNHVYYEYINGLTLREFINQDFNFTDKHIEHIIISMCNILKDLQRLNIIHKDIKPENIIVEDTTSKIYLIDFGVSRIDSGKEADTTLFGTKGYASPEHFGFTSTSYKSDIYSLGVIIKEIDKFNNYTLISDRCTQINPDHRYESYDEIIKTIDKPKLIKSLGEDFVSTIQSIKPKHNKRYFGIPMILYIIFIMIMMLISGVNSQETSQEKLTALQFISIYILASFMLIDSVDYIRVTLFMRGRLKELYKKKLIISFIVYMVGFILYAI